MSRLRPLAMTALMSAVVITTSGAAVPPGGDAVGFADLTDSRGVSVDRFTIEVNDGNRLNPADTHLLVWSMATKAAWEGYRFIISMMIWLLDWVLQLAWVEWLLTPLRGLSEVARSLVDAIGLTPLMLTVLALVVAYWWMKGRYAGGLAELGIGVVIAALATTVLANPMSVIAGPDGLLYTGRDAGLDIATAVTTDGRVLDGDGIDPTLTTEAMVDALIRIPHQVVNYGSVIDGGPCEETYTASVGQGLRDQIGGCDQALRQYADAPNERSTGVAWSLLPASVFFMLFSAAIAIVLGLAVLLAGWAAIKMIWQLVFGVVSGAMRGALFRSFADAVGGAVMVATATVFCVAWMKLLIAFHTSTSTDVPWIMRMYLLNGLMIVGAVAIFVIRSKVKHALRNTAARLAALGPMPSQAPEPSRLPALAARTATHFARDAWLHGRLAKSARPQLGPSPAPAPAPAPVNIGKVSAHPVPSQASVHTRLALPPGPGGGPVGPSPSPPSTPSPGSGRGAFTGASAVPGPSASRLASRLGTGLTVAAHGAAFFATGGSSAAVTGLRLLDAARRTGHLGSTAAAITRRPTRPSGARPASPPTVATGPVTPRMQPTAPGLARDTQTGVTYRRTHVTTNGARVEVLQPADRLRERLRGGAR